MNNFAYEIRFVDNNVVQVFNLAAKKDQQRILPIEYREDDVLRGQARYSKLLGTSSVKRDLFGYEEGLEYQHHVHNNRSKQRDTFIMLGTDIINEEDEDDDIVSPISSIITVSPSVTVSPIFEQEVKTVNHHEIIPIPSQVFIKPPIKQVELQQQQPVYEYISHKYPPSINKKRDCSCIIS